jgi:hypothetical protein
MMPGLMVLTRAPRLPHRTASAITRSELPTLGQLVGMEAVGHLVGLRVKRVDLLHGRVTVAEQVAEVNGRLLPGPPKTEAGRRTVTLPAAAAVALAEHLASFAAPGPEGLVFPAPEGGYLRRSNFRRSRMLE